MNIRGIRCLARDFAEKYSKQVKRAEITGNAVNIGEKETVIGNCDQSEKAKKCIVGVGVLDDPGHGSN